MKRACSGGFLDREIEQICFLLFRERYSLAFVASQDSVFYSRFPLSLAAPSSAVIKLLQGLYDINGRDSFRVVRNRVCADYALSEKCRGMIKVAAKRSFESVRALDHSISLGSISFVEVGCSDDVLYFPQSDEFGVSSLLFETRLDLSEIKKVLSHPGPSIPRSLLVEIFGEIERLRLLNPRSEFLFESDRQILAVLIGPEGEVLGVARNTNSVNRTLHAEVNLIQDFFRRTGEKIPPGPLLFSSHKPCKMCAGMIYDWSADPGSVRVYYQHEETGSLSQNTALDRLGNQTRVD